MAAAAAFGCESRSIERSAPDVPVVSEEVARDPAAASAATARLFTAKNGLGRFGRFSVVKAGDDPFPVDEQLGSYKDQPALQQYVAIAREHRVLDLYVYDFSDADDKSAYWESEYTSSGRPVPFRCNFLVHIESAAPERTRLSVFEVAPRVWLGRKFAFEAHGPGMYLDIRSVAPTTGDRRELLALITRAIGAQ